MQGLRIDRDVGGAIIGEVVLGLRHDAAMLNAFDLRGGDLPGQKRILAKGVVGAEEARIAVNVDERFEHHVNT
jgi:hypothetical protein